MLRRLLPLVVLLLYAGCSDPLIPQEKAFVTGRITGISPERHFRMEAFPELGSQVSRAIVRVGPETEVLLPGGRVGSLDVLALDAVVSVWITGPVRESDPPQVSARVILIHPPAEASGG